MTTDVAGPIREANVGRNALLSAAQVDELVKRALRCERGWEREARDDFLRLILSLHSVTNYTDPISIAFVPRSVVFCASAKYYRTTLAPKILLALSNLT